MATTRSTRLRLSPSARRRAWRSRKAVSPSSTTHVSPSCPRTSSPAALLPNADTSSTPLSTAGSFRLTWTGTAASALPSSLCAAAAGEGSGPMTSSTTSTMESPMLGIDVNDSADIPVLVRSAPCRSSDTAVMCVLSGVEGSLSSSGGEEMVKASASYGCKVTLDCAQMGSLPCSARVPTTNSSTPSSPEIVPAIKSLLCITANSCFAVDDDGFPSRILGARPFSSVKIVLTNETGSRHEGQLHWPYCLTETHSLCLQQCAW
mmetsp:Transcript_53536/g.107275  ORF Transcript_53536/g.107275 Transcript_53536/m.107275 type:complete len:262 (-) Transcript_53536:415-1200(-)